MNHNLLSVLHVCVCGCVSGLCVCVSEVNQPIGGGVPQGRLLFQAK